MPTNTMDAIDAAFQHLRSDGIEGFRTEGYIPPGSSSGVTIGAGVDLHHQTEDGLREMGVPDAIVTKIAKTGFLGKDRSEVASMGLDPKSLVLTEEEAEALSKPFVAEHYKAVKPYAGCMSQKGINVLISLRHWTYRLGKQSGPLAPDGENLVWEVIKGKTATDEDLKEALNNLLSKHAMLCTKDFIRNRIKNEIDHLCQ